MANSIVSTWQGIDYQARLFWIQACRMYGPRPVVAKVGFDVDDVKSFDDIVVQYNSPITDPQFGNPISTDYYQVKYHTTQNKTVGWQELMLPSFINATSQSLLQKLANAQKQYAPKGHARFFLVLPWQISQNDPLSSLLCNSNGELKLNLLYDDTGPHGKMGMIRAEWTKHLELNTEAELRNILSVLRIKANSNYLSDLKDQMRNALYIAGFKPSDDGSISELYDELIRKFRSAQHIYFDAASLKDLCSVEGLWLGCPAVPREAKRIGIRSFYRFAEYMESETDACLCLLEHFQGRYIKELPLWETSVYPALSTFLSTRCDRNQCNHILLDSHASIAFAAGFCLDSKSGVKAFPLQKTLGQGSVVWNPEEDSSNTGCTTLKTEEIQHNSEGDDIALVLNVTHDILSHVKLYIEKHLPNVRLILSAKVGHENLSTSITGGQHAFTLAQELVVAVRKAKSHLMQKGTTHIFAAAPNGLMFFMGQNARSCGKIVLYEFDFDGNESDSYSPSLSLSN
jgi:hypothetical protein